MCNILHNFVELYKDVDRSVRGKYVQRMGKFLSPQAVPPLAEALVCVVANKSQLRL